LQPLMRHTGPTLSPFNAWIMLKGLETLDIRVARHCANARDVAGFLGGLAGVRRVIYPGFEAHPQAALVRRQMKDGGNLVSFDLEGGKERAFRFLNRLRLVDISNNLGDAKSLITHPATTTHRAMGPEGRARIGVTDGMLRLSVGLEDPGDLAEDLLQAIEAAF
ncbi:MAG: PLP-dependent transferase, partial [Kiloniellales bacterium]|nr:PLP-dependent transferase [Kiloniellales bacterium]